MDAISHTVTTPPSDLVAALSLEAGAVYYGQNLSPTATLFGLPKATAPTLPADAFKYESGASFQFDVDGPHWFWTDDPGGCKIILNKVR